MTKFNNTTGAMIESANTDMADGCLSVNRLAAEAKDEPQRWYCTSLNTGLGRNIFEPASKRDRPLFGASLCCMQPAECTIYCPCRCLLCALFQKSMARSLKATLRRSFVLSHNCAAAQLATHTYVRTRTKYILCTGPALALVINGRGSNQAFIRDPGLYLLLIVIHPGL